MWKLWPRGQATFPHCPTAVAGGAILWLLVEGLLSESFILTVIKVTEGAVLCMPLCEPTSEAVGICRLAMSNCCFLNWTWGPVR